MPQAPFSLYGRTARPLMAGTAKVFFVAPTSSALTPDFQALYRTDEDGYVRVFENDFVTPISFMASGRGDTMFILPGTYTITAPIAASVNGMRLIGLGTLRLEF